MKKYLTEFLSILNEQKETIEKAISQKEQLVCSSKPATPIITNAQVQAASSALKSAASSVQSASSAPKNVTHVSSDAASQNHYVASAPRIPQLSAPIPANLVAPAPRNTIQNTAQVPAHITNQNPQPSQAPIQNINTATNNLAINRNVTDFSRQKPILENYSASSHAAHDQRLDIIQKLQYMQSLKRNLANSNINIDMGNPLFAQRQVSQSQNNNLPQTKLYSPTMAQEFSNVQAQPIPSYPHIYPPYNVVSNQPPPQIQAIPHHNAVSNQPPPQVQAIPHHSAPHNPQTPFHVFNPFHLQQAHQTTQVVNQRDAHARLMFNPSAPANYVSASIGRPHQFSQQATLHNPPAIYHRPIAPLVSSSVVNRPAYPPQVAHPQSIAHNKQAPVYNQHANARFTTSQVGGSRSRSSSNQSISSVPQNIRPSPEISDSHYHNSQYQFRDIQRVNTVPESGNPMLIQTSSLSNSINYQPSPISVPQGYSINLKSAAHEAPPVSGNAQSGSNTPTQPDFIQSLSSPRHRSATPKSVADQSPNPNQF